MHVKPRKGRRGRAHWRVNRALIFDIAWVAQWERITTQYMEANQIDSYWYDSGTQRQICDWLAPQLINARVVYDCVYDQMGIHFDDESSRALFILQWA